MPCRKPPADAGLPPGYAQRRLLRNRRAFLWGVLRNPSDFWYLAPPGRRHPPALCDSYNEGPLRKKAATQFSTVPRNKEHNLTSEHKVFVYAAVTYVTSEHRTRSLRACS